MKYYTALAILLGCILSAAETRLCSLTTNTLNGTLMENGLLTVRKEMVMQQNDEAIVLEAEDADSIFFQADVFARKSGAQGIDLEQIKRSANEYTPQNDIADASGKYIDYCQQAVWQFRIKKHTSYFIWLRTQVPITGNWGHTIIIDNKHVNGVNVGTVCKTAKKWYWVLAIEAGLQPGVHTFAIRDFLNGKRLDQILITPSKAKPETADAMPPTAPVKFTEGDVVFDTAMPIGIRRWKRLVADEAPGVKWLVSDDGGEHYRETRPGVPLDSYGTKPLTLKAILSIVGDKRPQIALPSLEYEHDQSVFNVFQSDTAEWYFTKAEGVLSGIKSKVTGREIQPIGQRLPMLELTFKEPGKDERVVLTEKDAMPHSSNGGGTSTLSSNGRALRTEWLFPKFDTRLTLDLKAEGALVRWDVTVENNGKTHDVIAVKLPQFGGMRISENPENDSLAWPFSAGEFVHSPAKRGTQKVIYPNHAGLGFADLYNKQEGFFMGITDDFIVSSQFLCDASPSMNSVTLSIEKQHRIKVGSSHTYHFTTAVHAGDWHSGAKIYRDWFYSKHPINAYRPWLRNADAWYFGSSIGNTGLAKKSKDYSVFRDDMVGAARYGLDYIQSWGAVFNGTCPAYYLPRKEKGGEEMFANMMKQWRDLGGKIGHYYYANGLAVYYLLSDKYFCTPWSEYPEDVRPPSFEWFLKNMSYGSSPWKPAPMEEMMAAINQLNKEIAEDTITKGMAEEGRPPLGGHLPMNWSNGEYPKFLYKWVDRYISKYHCNTAYLDTFAFANVPDFNPHLGMNGEGDKPMHKLVFLRKMMSEMRAKEPEFCSITEGIGDVFGSEGLCFVISGFARQPAIYRYTLPDHIIFQGGCNGLWTEPKMVESTRQAFLHGNRFDLIVMFSKVYHILKLKQSIAPFLNQSVFDDTIGISCDSNLIDCYAHICNSKSADFIPNGGTRAVTLTISNPAKASAKISYALPKGFTLNSAVLCELGRKPKKIDIEAKDGIITFDAPKSFVSALVLIDQVHGDHLWTAYAEQADKNTSIVSLFNFRPQKTTLSVSLFGEERKLELAPLSGELLSFERKGDNEKADIAKLTVSGEGISRTTLTSIGSEYSVARFKLEKPKVTDDEPLLIDFEEGIYSTENPKDGKRSLRLKGNGKFCYASVKFGLEPETEYILEFDFCKSLDCNPENGKTFAMACNDKGAEAPERYAMCAYNNSVPVDGKFHHVKTNFKTGKDVKNPAFYIYNIDSANGVVYLDNLSIKVKK